MKDLLKEMVEYFNFVNNFLRSGKSQEDVDTLGRSTMLSATAINLNNTTGKFEQKSSERKLNANDTQKEKFMKKIDLAEDALKKIHLKMFRVFQAS